MKWLRRTLLEGLATLLPLVLTIWLLWWLGSLAEDTIGWVLEHFLLHDHYVFGMGVVAGLVSVFLVGVLMRALVVRNLTDWVEGRLARIPFVKSIYGSLRDVVGFMFKTGATQEGIEEVVEFDVPGTDFSVLGFVTRRNLPELGDDDRVAVYLPMSYQIGGYTLLVPREHLRKTDLSVDEGLKFALTAGLASVKRPDTATASGSDAEAQANRTQ